MSRLLTTLLLYRSGYFIGKYISLEAKISIIKDCYYEALEESQYGWNEGKDDPSSFIRFYLSIIDMAYCDFEDRFELVKTKLSANDMVAKIVEKKIGKITKSDIIEECPNLSYSAIEKAIANLIKIGVLKKEALGRRLIILK